MEYILYDKHLAEVEIEEGMSYVSYIPTADTVEFFYNPPVPVQPNNEIWYVTNNNQPINIHNVDCINDGEAALLSNTYTDGLGKIVFSQDIKTIGYGLTYDAATLVEIMFPNSVKYFGVTVLGGTNDNLERIKMPRSMIGNLSPYAFDGCPKLPVDSDGIKYTSNNSADYPAIYCSVPSTLTATDYTIKSGTRYICEGAFAMVKHNFTKLTFPSSLFSAPGYDSFSEASNLQTIIFEEGIERIDGWSLNSCPSLTSITLPSSLNYLGDGAFQACENLASVTFAGNSVTAITSNTFSYCTSLTSITLPSSLIILGGLNNTAISSITVPNGVTTLVGEAFSGCANLSSVTLPNTITNIGYSVFSSCPLLTSINLQEGIEIIQYEAFRDCTGITSITLPSTLTEVGECAFAWCTALTTVTCLATIPPSAEQNIFEDNAPNRKIYVPAASVDAYKAANGWSQYAASIEAIPS